MLIKPCTTHWTFLHTTQPIMPRVHLPFPHQLTGQVGGPTPIVPVTPSTALILLCGNSHKPIACSQQVWRGRISRNNSTHTLIPVACQYLQAGVGAGFPAPALGVDQCSSSSAEQLPDTKMGFAWKPLQHTPMTRTERVLKRLSPSFRLLPSSLTLKGNSERTKSSAVQSELAKKKNQKHYKS